MGCDDLPFVTSPIATSQQLSVGDCAGGGFLADFFFVGLPQGATLTASLATQSFAPWITLTDDATGGVVASGTGTSTAAVTFTNSSADSEGLYFLRATSVTAGGAGPYTLNVSIAYPPSTTAIPLATSAPAQREAGAQPRRPATAMVGQRRP
jgi:hypothetical protein